ncbi:MAG: YggT family protein [Cyanobacteria bacterium SZAS LIN-2]|nr:YggT family protein [Cyanobacteria bacterium SZAS LIN-3]MBS1994746.1 YggT family protein [Cyanobacteria bacterium SZAS LIN-2]MBS2009956.1 YggT family protein [Cyanobacteria bacterium SZAS TMP-1]
MNALLPIVQILNGVLNLFSMALFIWCLLSWFPNINRREQPWALLDNIVRPIISPIQKIVPPIGNIDVSPIVLCVVLQVLAKALNALLLPSYY